jgi:cytochrome b subunit of formate dehydrogenase
VRRPSEIRRAAAWTVAFLAVALLITGLVLPACSSRRA